MSNSNNSASDDFTLTPEMETAPSTHREEPSLLERQRARRSRLRELRRARFSTSFEIGNCLITLNAYKAMVAQQLTPQDLLMTHRHLEKTLVDEGRSIRRQARIEGKPIVSNFPVPFDGRNLRKVSGIQVITNATREVTVIRTFSDPFTFASNK